jgi:hypothetical protein
MPDRRRAERRRDAGIPSNSTLARTPPQAAALPSNALWDARDVATFLKASRNWVYQQVELGKIPCVRIGALLRFDPEKVKALARGELLVVSTARLK